MHAGSEIEPIYFNFALGRATLCYWFPNFLTCIVRNAAPKNRLTLILHPVFEW